MIKVEQTPLAPILDKANTAAPQLFTTLVEGLAPIIPVNTQFKAINFALQNFRKIVPRKPHPYGIERPLPDPANLALKDIDMGNPFHWKQDKSDAYFKRLRDECPVHYRAESPFGPFWSITRFEDIMYVDKNHDIFSAEPMITLGDAPKLAPLTTFIAMDPPKHDMQRNAVQPVVAPKNLKELEGLIRERVEDILDNIPVGTTFDWVDRVSIELTARMLATLFDFPYDKRRKLAEISDLFGSNTETVGGDISVEDSMMAGAEMMEMFGELWHSKMAAKEAGQEMGYDLMSLLVSSDKTSDMIERPMEFMGNMMLLVVGGNDTTRNSISGGVLALNQFPDQFKKLKEDPSLIPNMVSEIIRWQTPLAYMRRVAKKDVELNGQLIKKGDKVVMWYASGNRDERHIDNPFEFKIDRKNARNHLSFGFGVHRCMGNRLAEMQLRILWEEILKRFDDIKVMAEPERVKSNFVRGYSKMLVQVIPK